ncbi:aminoglycoside phosphotransferase family protein [Aspergillus ibericus CBS 121593]|uniref:Kinase-like protein n=1 Tax=Aspergillus ibericus CBS 121593 TaxID=1448316 RepID=A0A395GM46_9EURO|nr:kinase-like protein [Aspergillus ibericus CBS 121593]RAK96386.1 kinase-like protein [Aspergillus ibericus CBS 121593]
MSKLDESDGIPYAWQNLNPGQRYIKVDNKMLFPCPPDVNVLEFPPNKEVITILAKQMARLVLEIDFSIVSKSGHGVRHSEAEAMKLVFGHTSVPVPEVIVTSFDGEKGNIHMTIIPGTCLEVKWDMLDIQSKESICLQLWDLISKWREIPLPSNLTGLYQCAADGSPSRDPLLEDLQSPKRPLTSDSELRGRIYERYLYFGGLRYKHTLPDMLPRSDRSVFTHGDIAPRNIMINDENQITGILDWEYAGWYPDYWEYAQIMRPAFHGDFQDLMNKTAPQTWDLSGINASRKVLF